MTKWERFKHNLFLLRHYLAEGLRNFRRKMWNKRLKLWWYRLFVRRDEFHRSLSTDADAMMVMNRQELDKYHADVARRRAIAHRRQLAREDAERGG